jgi:hypothetical protein
MLDWFSQSRMSEEQREDARPAPFPGQILRDYCFFKPDGRLLFLSTLRSRLILTLLPYAQDPAQAWLPALLTNKFPWVRREQTRVLVVTRPEYLSTVVALGGNLLIVADETGDAMVELKAIESPKCYFIGPKREMISELGDPNLGGQLSDTGLRPAA